MKLDLANLDQLPEMIERPRYQRAELAAGMVHIGVGNFHRAHQAWYLHRLMQAGIAHDWAILGAGVRDYDVAMRERLLAQDCLTTLIELDQANPKVEIVGSMIDYLPIAKDNGPLIAAMARAEIRIVSLTITEGGYYLDVNGEFDADHPDIRADAAHPEAPQTVFGALVAALNQRRAAGLAPFTALSCDNLQGNGKILRQCVTGLARLIDSSLAEWIENKGSFPNSMVDCIVPATSPEVVAQARELGIADAAPVTHENFRQWVIEDDFCAGRPPWEQAGATLTQQVHLYEAMKLRILNGGHQLLANVGEILSVETIADCMNDTHISAFFGKVQMEEILPHVAAVPEITPDAYLSLVKRRFANVRIHDTTQRVAYDGSARHMGFLLPTIRDALAAGAPMRGLALGEALWARMCAGEREDGSEIAPNDPHWDMLQEAALRARVEPRQWLAQESLYGSLVEDKVFVAHFEGWLKRLWQEGARAALAHYLEVDA